MEPIEDKIREISFDRNHTPLPRWIATRVLKPSTRYYPGSTDAISPPLTLALARDGFRWPRAAVIMLGGGVAEM